MGTTIPYRPPVVAFNASTTTGAAPLALNFVATVQGAATSYLWNFGDGSTSTAPNPAHVYAAPGVYSVSVTVTGPGGTATSTRIGYVTVVPAAAGSGGVLAGTLTPMPTSVDLTSVGTIDWVQWPGNVRKAGVPPRISGRRSSGVVPLRLPTNEPGALRWNDGTPVAAGSINEAVSVSGTGRGFESHSTGRPDAAETHVVRGCHQRQRQARGAPLGRLGVGVRQRARTESGLALERRLHADLPRCVVGADARGGVDCADLLEMFAVSAAGHRSAGSSSPSRSPSRRSGCLRHRSHAPGSGRWCRRRARCC